MMLNNFAAVNGAFIGMSFGLMALFAVGSLLFLILIVGMIVLKGYALWNAAKRDEVGWFIALLIVNTAGILELIYLYFVVGKWRNKK